MNAVRLMAAMVLVAGALGGVQGEQQQAQGNKEKIVGLWEVTKGDKGTSPGMTMDFRADGKATIVFPKEEGVAPIEGTYTVAGDKLTLTRKKGGEEAKQTLTITKLTATHLFLEDAKEGGKAV